MRRVVVGSVIATVAIVACHSVVLRVDRKSSVGFVHTPAPEPRVQSYDGHVIALPEARPVNCYDLLRNEAEARPRDREKLVQRGKDGPALDADDKKFNVFTSDFITCSAQDFVVDFPGYWPSWGDKPFDTRLAQTLPETCTDRRDLCKTAVNQSYPPAWYSKSPDSQRVHAAWILDEFGWPRSLDGTRAGRVKKVTNSARTSTLQFETAPTLRTGCLLVRKRDVSKEVRDDCGVYGYPVLQTETANAAADEIVISLEQVHRVKSDCGDDGPELEIRIDQAHPTVDVIIEPCPDPKTLLSFIHLSDAQIREPNAKVVNRAASRELDKVVSSFEYDYEQMLYSPFFYEAMIETINKEVAAATPVQRVIDGVSPAPAPTAPTPAPTAPTPTPTPTPTRTTDLYRAPPSFMIHTGDAVDSGLASEFRYFLETSNRLTIPWYQVIGNHDVLAFGNLKLGNVRDNDDDKNYVCTSVRDLLKYTDLHEPVNNDNEDYRTKKFPLLTRAGIAVGPRIFDNLCLIQEVVGDEFVASPTLENETPTRAFMRAHCRLDRYERCKPHRPKHGVCKPDGYWRRLHGFQGCFDDDLEAPNPYYAFVADVIDPATGRSIDRVTLAGETTARRVWVVALNTAYDVGAYGVVDERQLRWLEQLLTNKEDTHPIRRGDLVMMFSHHPIWSIHDDHTRRRIEDLIARSGNVVGFFAGHTHRTGLRAVPYMKLDARGKNPTRVTCDGTKPCGYWEVIAPSMIEFPQQGRQVTLKYLEGSSVAYFDILTFAPHLAEAQGDLERAMKGAERDACATNPDSCENDRPRPPKQEHMYSRLFFRLPPLGKDRPRTDDAAICRPAHVQMPNPPKKDPTDQSENNARTRCDRPCEDKRVPGEGTCKEPPRNAYFAPFAAESE